MRRWRRAAALVLGLAVGAPATAARAAPGEELTVRVLTIGPEDNPFFSVGESAIWIQDERAGTGVVYGFGALEPDSPWSLFAWLAGRMKNRVSRVGIQEALDAFRSQNRGVETQTLEMSPAVRTALRRALEAAALPENRDYSYDPVLSNGATRVRDEIDRATGGRLRAAASRMVPSRSTLRQETLRLTRSLVPAYLFAYLSQGAAADRPLDSWGRMFLPGEIQATLRNVGRAGSWNDIPLVMSEGTLLAAPRDQRPPPSGQAGAVGRLVAVGLAIGTALALGGWAARRRPRLRTALGVSMGVIGLALGLLGGTLVLGWCLGDNLTSRRNENILQLAPWALVLPLLAAGVAAGRPAATRKAFWIAASASALAAGGLLLKVTPWFRQDNLPLIGAFLPMWVGLAVGLRALWRE
jgi:hypothetical protein